MKKIIVIFILISFLRFSLFGQNLVQNGSFEVFTNGTNIPTPPYNSYDIYDSVFNWNSANGTCDVFSPYLSMYYLGTPSSPKGYQMPRTGNNYVGAIYESSYSISTGNIIAGQEIPQVHLSIPLVQNQTYKIRAFITSLGWLGSGNYAALDSFGFIISDTSYNQAMFSTYWGNPMPFQPDIVDTINTYYTDTTIWYEVTGEYTAHGGEEYLLMGYFLSKTSYPNLPILHNVYGSLYSLSSYNIFDDVAIWPADTIPPPADAGQDTTICRGGKARLGTHNYSDYIYEWWPAATLSNDSGGVVWASPDTTTTYYLQATDDIFTKTMDSVTVYVNNCGQNDTVVCIEQQFTMGSTNNPNWHYQWTPSAGLSSDTVGMPLCSLLSNQSYQLLITNSTGDTIALDSTTVLVGSCYYAEAGIDSIICKGDSLVIGMQNLNFLDFKWWPNFMISDTAVGNPSVWPDTLTWYFLQLTDTMGNVSFDSVLVDVHICSGINTAFPFENGIRVYPNPATEQITIEFEEPIQIKQVNIYNIQGKLIENRHFDANKDKTIIGLKGMQKGLYFLIIETKNNLYFKKIIIE